MKAAQINKYGYTSVIEINSNAAEPPFSGTQLLVEVHAASLNPIDYKLRKGYLATSVKSPFPLTLGGDFSGIVARVGSEVSDIKEGDEVFGNAFLMNGGSGSLAELCACNRKNLHLKPSLSFDEAASLPLAGTSAVQALFEQIGLKREQKILIHGGAGGIGTLAIQISKAMGGYVAATASESDKELLRTLGADLVIDYRNQNFEDIVKDYDAVLDTVGGDTYRRSFNVLKKGGVINSMLESPDEKLAKKHEVKALYQFTITDTARLSHLSEFTGSGSLKPVIDKVYHLDQTREAFEHFETAHKRGKVIVRCR